MRHHYSQAPADARFSLRLISWLAFLLVAGWCQPIHAQWITQTNTLKPGWNAVYLHVDASHTNVNSLINALDPIDEVWLWTFDLPPGLSLATPPDPTLTPTSQWSKWTKLEGVNSALKTLSGNSALLVKASANFAWRVKGRAVAPSYRWTLSGLNFVGFPTSLPGPNFETFLAPDAQALDWKQSAEIFRYQGGILGATNPIQVTPILQRNVPVVRDQAYWIRAGEPTNQVFNHYFGPFQVTGSGSTGLRFGDSQGQARLYLKNMSASNLFVTLREVLSEAPPTGPVPSLLPLMVRGPLVTTNLSFTYSSLMAGPSSWNLAAFGQPGSEVEIILGVDRTLMGTTPGATYAGVLRFTDTFGLTRVEIGVSATTTSRTGLWVGNAAVDNVGEYLKPYLKATNASHFHTLLNNRSLTVGVNNPTGTNILHWATSVDGRLRFEWDANSKLVLVFGTNAAGKVSTGTYFQDGPILTNLTKVARPFPLRLIVHNNGTSSRLVQRVYLGRDAVSNEVVATRQDVVAGDLVNARRISAVHLPTSDGNIPWTFTGALQPGSDLVTTIDIVHSDHTSNPFLHTYHPDHDDIDNRDNTFRTPAIVGQESYDLRRMMKLSFKAPGDDFDSRTRGGTRLEGNYSETVSIRTNTTVLKQFNVLGSFILTRISDTATLVQ